MADTAPASLRDPAHPRLSRAQRLVLRAVRTPARRPRELEQWPSARIPGFVDRLIEVLPGSVTTRARRADAAAFSNVAGGHVAGSRGRACGAAVAGRGRP